MDIIIILMLMNALRSDANIPALATSTPLTMVAQAKCDEMYELDYFAHESPVTGKKSWYLFDQFGYDYTYAGENLAMGFGKDEEAQNLAWKNSPLHYSNIVKPGYSEVGIATCGKDRVVVEFAQPATTSPSVI